MNRSASNHGIECTCGALAGTLEHGAAVNRCVCYCKSCQAFAHYLERSAEILDARGGTEVLQTQPRFLRFDKGRENLACMRLSETGILRWYTSCCRTPIGNTLGTKRLPFISLIHPCVLPARENRDASFGPVRTVVNTESAAGSPKPEVRGLFRGAARVVWQIGWARVSGGWRDNPFFDPTTGEPVAKPNVLSSEEREALYARVAPAPDL